MVPGSGKTARRYGLSRTSSAIRPLTCPASRSISEGSVYVARTRLSAVRLAT